MHVSLCSDELHPQCDNDGTQADTKFQHMLRELESVRKQAYEDKCSREKVERELFEAFQKVSVAYFAFFSHVKYTDVNCLFQLNGRMPVSALSGR